MVRGAPGGEGCTTALLSSQVRHPLGLPAGSGSAGDGPPGGRMCRGRLEVHGAPTDAVGGWRCTCVPVTPYGAFVDVISDGGGVGPSRGSRGAAAWGAPSGGRIGSCPQPVGWGSCRWGVGAMIARWIHGPRLFAPCSTGTGSPTWIWRPPLGSRQTASTAGRPPMGGMRQPHGCGPIRRRPDRSSGRYSSSRARRPIPLRPAIGRPRGCTDWNDSRHHVRRC